MVDVANGKVLVVIVTGHAGIRGVIEKSKYAQDIGANGIMVMLSHHHVPSEEGLYLHYKEIAEAIDIGLVMYNNPDFQRFT